MYYIIVKRETERQCPSRQRASETLRRKEKNMEMTDKEIKAVEKATIYDLRRIFTSGEKKEYTTEEIAELLDKIAEAKGQE